MEFKLKNFSLKFFNNDINNSYHHKHKYEFWSDYRDTITKFIKKSITYDMKSIIVLGSGKCNDLSLSYLCENFEKIVLSDIDENSIKVSIAFQKLTDSQTSKIYIAQADYTGLQSADFFAKLESLVRQNKTASFISSFIEKNIMTLETKQILSDYQKKFDAVLSCPIYTQLFYSQTEIFLQILSQYRIYCNNDLLKMDKSFKKSMSRITCNYNNLALSFLKKGGKIIILTDIIEFQKSENLNKKIKEILSVNPINTRLLEKHIAKYGLTFAKKGRRDLLEKISTKNILYAHWPFDEYKDYLVYGVTGNAK